MRSRTRIPHNDNLPSERNVVVLWIVSLRLVRLRLLPLRLGLLELGLVAVLDLIDDPMAEAVVAGAADVGG